MQAQSTFVTPLEGKYGNQYIINNYVDCGPGNDFYDYYCLSKNLWHAGTDYIIRNFALMDSGIFVLAAESGVVSSIQQDLFDREKLADPSKGFGNYIAINHFNGFQTYYAHLKKKVCKWQLVIR